MRRCKLIWLTVVLCWAGITPAADTKATPAETAGSPYLFVWTGDATHHSSDFLAVIDANPASPSYARIVASLPVGASGTMPHHTEYDFPADNLLFANGWVAGRTFILDLSHPLKPRVVGDFTTRAGYAFPHSFVRLPNGNLLVAFQSYGQGYAPGGGLVELDVHGAVIRSSSAVDRAVDRDLIWPYSLTIVPKLNLVVSSSTPMGWPDWKALPAGSWSLEKVNNYLTAQIQFWQLSDLKLKSTLTLADSSGKHNVLPAEPRLLPDGSIYVNTFSCGLYLLKDVTAAQPSAWLVHTFPGGADTMETMCGVPVIVGHYWIQTVSALPGLIALDISNPEKPVEVSRLVLDKQFVMPHWLAADRKSNRLVITGNDHSWLLVARIDQDGRLSIDTSFHDGGEGQPGISFDRQDWPHGTTGPAIVHGALFGPN